MSTDTTKDIVSGDDVLLPVTLKRKGIPVDVSNASSIKASLLSYSKDTIIINPVDLNIATTGSDWANGVVVVDFDSTSTLLITRADRYKIEIQVDDGGKQTWFVSVEAELGTIT